MAIDAGLMERIRAALGDHEGVAEKKMFGTVAVMVHGNMLVAPEKGTLMVRLAKDVVPQVLEEEHVEGMVQGGRTSTTFVRVHPVAYAEDEELQRWIDLALAYNATLPPK